MASHALARSTPTTIRVVAPPPTRTQALVRAARARAGHIVRRAGGAAMRAAIDEKHRMYAFGGAAAMGYIDGAGIDFPHIDAVGKAGTAAIAAYGLYKMTGSRAASHVCTGLGSIAIHDAVAARARGGGSTTRPQGGTSTTMGNGGGNRSQGNGGGNRAPVMGGSF